MSLLIRQYNRTDQDKVMKLHIEGLHQFNASIGDPSQDKDMIDIEEHYISSGGDFIVVELDCEVVGMGALRNKGNSIGEIKRIRVDRAHQRKGIGQIILGALESSARSKGYNKLVLDTTSNQVPAQKLFEKNGYIETTRKMIGELEVIFYKKILSG